MKGRPLNNREREKEGVNMNVKQNNHFRDLEELTHKSNFRRMVESDLLHIFGQMVSAIRYMHRDNSHTTLKTVL